MSLVRVRISDVALREVLHLPADTVLAGAATEHTGVSWPPYASSLVLILDAPDAPEGAVEMTPVYQRERIEVPDRVELTGIDWRLADSTVIHQDVTGESDPLVYRGHIHQPKPQGAS